MKKILVLCVDRDDDLGRKTRKKNKNKIPSYWKGRKFKGSGSSCNS